MNVLGGHEPRSSGRCAKCLWRQQGEAIGIIGRNGAGKSTLLKILSRITEPTTGRVGLKGRVASLLEVGTGFHPELTGGENIFLNGAILGMTRVEIRKKFDEIVAFAEVEKFIDMPVKHYSSGKRVDALYSTESLRGFKDGCLSYGQRSGNTESALRAVYGPSDQVIGPDRAIDFDVRCYLPGDILVKVDRAAMANGLETRAPFLDVDLVEFTLSLPWQLRFKEDQSKHLLRSNCADLWPVSVQQRSKQGFGAPISAWVQRPDMRALMKRIHSPQHPLSTILPGVDRIDHRRPQLCWSILCLGLWLEGRTACLDRLR